MGVDSARGGGATIFVVVAILVAAFIVAFAVIVDISVVEPLKLSVGQVLKMLIEDNLTFALEPYGRILDLTVIRDQRTGSHRGCAFVTYERGGDAVRVAEEMHGKYKFDVAKEIPTRGQEVTGGCAFVTYERGRGRGGRIA